MEPNADVHAMGRRALSEVGGVLDAVSGEDVEAMCRELRAARRIACYGVGREGLMMKALCMRLMHLGLDTHVVGDMTTLSLVIGDGAILEGHISMRKNEGRVLPIRQDVKKESTAS